MTCDHCGEPFTYLFFIDGLLSDVPDGRTTAFCEEALRRGMDPESRIEVWGCVTDGCCDCRFYRDVVATV